MKHSIFYLLAIGVAFASCDRVENPIPGDAANYDITLFPGNYAAQYNYPTFGANNNSNVNVLIEDYTGHQCGNCPAGAIAAKGVEDANPGRVIVVSEHAGYGGISQYQRIHTPDEPEYPKYSRDFTNEAGLTYVTAIAGILGNPYGMVNRKPATGSSSTSPWIPYGQWQVNAENILQENNLRANIQMAVNYYDETDALFVHVEAESKTALTGNYNLVVYAIAKDVVDWQKNYTVFPNDVEFYHHHNVHIGNVNGTWGDPVFSGEIASGTKIRKDYTYKIRENFRDLEYAVVAYLMNADTYEILQVIMVEP
jgi:hypothetical protein